MDDELLVGGPLLYALSNNKDYEPYVVFTTNGDYFNYGADTRAMESVEANGALGIKEDHLIYLGYGDSWKGEKTVYSATSDEVVVSHAGFRNTYAAGEHKDFHYLKYGEHAEYTHNNFVNDIADVIEDIRPQIIVLVGPDYHTDHMGTYLLTLEALKKLSMREVMANDTYNPLVLVKVAYEGMIKGPHDYYSIPFVPSRMHRNCLKTTDILKWEKRIRFVTPAECLTEKLSDNPLYRAAVCYNSQGAKYFIDRSVNKDIVYWAYDCYNEIYYEPDDNELKERLGIIPLPIDDSEENITYKKNHVKNLICLINEAWNLKFLRYIVKVNTKK